MVIVLSGGTCVVKWRFQPQLTEDSPPSLQHMACCYSNSYPSSQFGLFRKVRLDRESRFVVKADKDHFPVSGVSENTRLSEIRSDSSTKRTDNFNNFNFSRRGFMYSTISIATMALPLLPLSHGGSNSHITAFAIGEGIDSTQTSLIRTEIQKVLSKFKAPSLLRLVFHDAGTFYLNEKTGGMNGSIIYELDRPENIGLSKPLKVLEKVRNEVEKVFPVSWADLIAMAGSEAVLFCGGPAIPVQIGRADAKLPDPPGKLPLETLNASELKSCFLEKGFSTQELVALSGAHTLGSKGFGSPYVFDNSYFKVLLEKPWASPAGMPSMIGLPSDRALIEDDECLRWIVTYAGDQVRFFDDFKSAYTKLVNCGTLWKDRGAM